jgi:D-alanyl-D-alanine carboxypeptidase
MAERNKTLKVEKKDNKIEKPVSKTKEKIIVKDKNYNKNLYLKYVSLVIIIVCIAVIVSGIIFRSIVEEDNTNLQVQDNATSIENVVELPSSEVKGTSTVNDILPVFKPAYLNPPPEITANAYAVEDMTEDKRIYSKNANLSLPPASITKIMTAIIALEEYELSREVLISEKCTLVEGSKVGFKAFDVLTLQDVLYGLLVNSGADAACAISNIEGDQIFIEKMNNKAEEMGMESTVFENEIGLDSQKFQYSSVNDLVKLTRYAIKYDSFSKIVGTEAVTLESLNSTNVYKLTNTNELLLNLPGTIGVKTGQTPEAGQCLSYMYENPSKKQKFLIVILGSSDRFGDTKKLLDWAKTETDNIKEKYPE